MPRIGPNIELIEKLKEGGTANVYLGVNTWTGYPVAVKELKPAFFKSQFVRDKFLDEANLYLELNHPNIVKLENYIDAGDRHYLVMEYIEGYNLSDYQNNVTGPMPTSMAALLCIEVLKALHYAHSRPGRQIVHLDIKPANVMLSDKNEVKVLDFGISQDMSESKSDKLLGTPSYMSPEQISGSGIDHRTDIYATGITLYELITGRPPFANSRDRQELFDAIRNKNIPEISGAEDITRVIRKATAKDKKNRYDNCQDFISDLEKFV